MTNESVFHIVACYMKQKTSGPESPKEDSGLLTFQALEFEQRHLGKAIKLYNGVIDADVLVEHFHIPEFKSGADTGYQRPAYPSRLVNIATYVLGKEGVMPTAILVNVRQNAVFQSSNGGALGTLTIPKSELLYVVDGQHRAKGLRIAKERKQPLQYELPIVFTLGLTEEEEMNLFFIVNSTQKSVPTDLNFEIMRKRIDRKASSIDGGSVTIPELRRFASVEIARTLVMDGKSVWFEKCQMADEMKQYQKPVRLATFAKSLDSFLSADVAHTAVLARDTDSLAEMVEGFWGGIKILAPAAIDDPEKYAIQGPTAVWVFGWVLRDLARSADRADDWSPKFWSQALRPLGIWVDSQTWHRKEGVELARAKGSGVARVIFEKVRELYAHPKASTD